MSHFPRTIPIESPQNFAEARLEAAEFCRLLERLCRGGGGAEKGAAQHAAAQGQGSDLAEVGGEWWKNEHIWKYMKIYNNMRGWAKYKIHLVW